jgi:hypothetical protein
MPRQIRDLVVTMVVLLVLVVMLVSINPRLRERAGQLAGNGEAWGALTGALGHAVQSASGVVTSFAGDNQYMFAFLVVAGVLFVLMLRT